MSEKRSPGVKLMIVGALGVALFIPLMMVYWLVGDRQHQARVAQNSVTAAWAGPQIVARSLSSRCPMSRARRQPRRSMANL
ncbi:MAG: inner membrane CreD family protein [Erythrobacter sp.]|nr:inner membrane CreD family protein [Erythrobacter sp.]